jgi:uncharacterized Zn finger protein
MKRLVKTWWGKKFLDTVGQFVDPSSLARGRQFLAQNKLTEFRLEGSSVSAQSKRKLQTMNAFEPRQHYTATLTFKTIESTHWDEALKLIGSRAGYITRLLFNEMPDEIEAPLSALGINLIPSNPEDLEVRCSCDENEAPCRHVAALFYFLALKLDRDPFILFELRGLSRDIMIECLKKTELGSTLASALDDDSHPLDVGETLHTRAQIVPSQEQISLEAFWHCEQKVPENSLNTTQPSVSALLARKGGDFPLFWTKDESFLATMDEIYLNVRKSIKSC